MRKTIATSDIKTRKELKKKKKKEKKEKKNTHTQVRNRKRGNNSKQINYPLYLRMWLLFVTVSIGPPPSQRRRVL